MSRGKSIHILLIFNLLCIYYPLLSQESAPPKPSALTDEWWQYFEPKDNSLQDRIDKTSNDLKQILASISPENKEKAISLEEKILANLQALKQLSEYSPPTLPAPKPAASHYSIDDILALNRVLLKNTIELKNSKAEYKRLESQKNASEDYLNNLKIKYSQLKDRTQDKLLLGLEVMEVRSAIEVTKKRLEYLNLRIESENEALKQTKEELQTAINRLVVTPKTISVLESDIHETKSTLEEAAKEQTKREIDAALLLPSTDPYENAKNQYLNQKEIQANINRALAKTHLINLQIELALANLILMRSDFDLEVLQSNLLEWKRELLKNQEHVSQWMKMIQDQTQKTSRVLSLQEKNPPEMIALQKDIIRLTYQNRLDIQRLNSEIENTQFVLKEVENKVFDRLGGGPRWFRKAVDFFTQTFERAIEWVNRALFNVGQTPITLLNILRFFFIIFLTIWISKLTMRGLDKALLGGEKRVRRSVAYRINRLVHYSILTLGFLIAFSTLGFNFTSLVLIISALGVGLGFGLQSIFNNFVSGIIILFESYLRVGDFIEIDSELRGEIKAINFRSLIIRTNDGIDVLIPNSDVINTKVVNWTLNDPYRRIHIPFSVAHGTDKDLVKDLIEEAAKGVEYTLNKPIIPSPKVRFLEFGDSRLEFELAVWVNERATRRTRITRSAYLWMIDDVFRKHGIMVPFPQRDLHIKEKPPEL